MGWIKKKQILGLDSDLGSLQFSSILLKRTTSFSGNPGEGEAILDNQTATSITTIKVNVKDSLIGNSYSQLQDITDLNDLIIRNKETGDVAIYSIQSIASEVNSSFEGYFILTVQHSFGYNDTFTSGELVYYFRGVTSSSIIDLIDDQSAIIEANNASITGQLITMQQNIDSSIFKKYAENIDFNVLAKTVYHNLNSSDVIIQLIDSNGGMYTNISVDNYNSNNVRITVNDLGVYRVIIMS